MNIWINLSYCRSMVPTSVKLHTLKSIDHSHAHSSEQSQTHQQLIGKKINKTLDLFILKWVKERIEFKFQESQGRVFGL